MNKYVGYLICALFTCIMIKYIILSDLKIIHEIKFSTHAIGIDLKGQSLSRYEADKRH